MSQTTPRSALTNHRSDGRSDNGSRSDTAAGRSHPRVPLQPPRSESVRACEREEWELKEVDAPLRRADVPRDVIGDCVCTTRLIPALPPILTFYAECGGSRCPSVFRCLM